MPPKQTDLSRQLLRDVARQARPHACGRRAARGDGIRTPQTIHTDSETCQQSASSQAVQNVCNLCCYWPSRQTVADCRCCPHPSPSMLPTHLRRPWPRS